MGTKNRRSGSQFNPKGVVQGVTLVCPDTGDPIQCIVDSNGKTRLLVDSQISVSIPSISVDLDGCAPDGDSVHIVDADNCYRMKVNADGSIDANVTVDAADGDNISISGHATPLFREFADTITTANFEEIFTFTSTNDNTMISKVECYIETPSTIKLFVDGTEIKRDANSSLKLKVAFNLDEPRPLLLGKILKVEAQVDRLITSKSPFETFCSLEGYIK